MKTSKKSFFSNLFSENGKNKNKNPEWQNDGRIDFGKISEYEENERKQNILKILFKNRKHKEKHSSDEDRPVVDAEAKKISERFNTAHNLLWLVLLLFVAVFCIFFSEGITTGNMQHMFRNMFGRGEVTEGTSSYHFSINENAVFDSISNIPIIAGSDRVVIFSPDGSHEYSEESEYSLPALKTSGKFALIYDAGGKAYGIYDEFGVCHFENSGGKIYDGSVSGDGTYAIARKGKEYMTEITLYNAAFEAVTVIKKNNAFASMDIKDDGSEIILVTYSVFANVNVESEIMLLEKGQKTPRKLFTLENGTPIECKYLENGNIAVLFDRSLVLFDRDGEKLASCAIDMNSIYMYNMSDGGRLLFAERIYGSSNTYKVELVAFDGVSVKKSQYTLKNKPVELNMYGDYAYIITENKVVRLDAENFDNETNYLSDRKINSLIFLSEDVFVCTADSAVKIVWDKDPE
ncbi:MAG: hypothetical protein E7633_06560 [Ruminococcaceae bacterium]|nr:hypothetical protein [Oscillospiraceae bacterium]